MFLEFLSTLENGSTQILTSTSLGVFLGFLIIFTLFSIIGLYIYTSLALQKIAKKLKYKNSWIAWIPIANNAMVLQLGGYNWAWIFLLFLPIFGWIALFVLTIISYWKIFEKRNYPGWLSLSLILPEIGTIIFWISLGFVAWKDQPKKK